MRYKIKAINQTGHIIGDIYTANNKDEVLNMIKSKKLIPLSIEEEFSIKLSSLANKKVRKKDLMIFSKLFHTMLDSGISISNSLDIIAENTTNYKLQDALININNDIHKGLALSDALERQKEIFPSIFSEMIRAGEVSGNLNVILKRLENYYDNQYKIDNKIRNSLVYPIIIIVVSLFVVVFMLTFVLPTFNDIFSTRELNLPLPTQLLLFISDAIKHHWGKGIITSAIVGLLISAYFKTEKGVLTIDYLKLNTPLYKKLYSKIASSNFTKTLSILLTSGIPLLKSLSMSSKVLNNSIIMKQVDKELVFIEEGKSLSESLKDLGILSSVANSMIKVGEETGTLDSMFEQASLYYDEEISTSFERITKLIEPALMLIVGFIVGYIVLSLALPMFNMMSTF